MKTQTETQTETEAIFYHDFHKDFTWILSCHWKVFRHKFCSGRLTYLYDLHKSEMTDLCQLKVKAFSAWRINCAIPPGRSRGFNRNAVRVITSIANSLLKLKKKWKERSGQVQDGNNGQRRKQFFSDDVTA